MELEKNNLSTKEKEGNKEQSRNRLTDVENNLVVTSREREREEGHIGVRDKEMQIAMYKINKEQGYIIQHREIQPLFSNTFKWSIIYKNIESLCCTPETNIIF